MFGALVFGFIFGNVIVHAVTSRFVIGDGEHVSAAAARCPVIAAVMITITPACNPWFAECCRQKSTDKLGVNFSLATAYELTGPSFGAK